MNLEILEQKLHNSQALYSNEEVNWLLENIGNPKSTIRDDLVCNALGSGFFEEKFTKQQVLFFIKQLRKKSLVLLH